MSVFAPCSGAGGGWHFRSLFGCLSLAFALGQIKCRDFATDFFSSCNGRNGLGSSSQDMILPPHFSFQDVPPLSYHTHMQSINDG